MTICIEGINKLRFPVYTSCAKDIKQWLLDIEDLLLLSLTIKSLMGLFLYLTIGFQFITYLYNTKRKSLILFYLK